MGSLFASSRFTQAIKNHLKNLIVTLGRNMTPQQQEAIDVTVAVIANDNVELACAFIQKKGIEKAIQETDKRLRSEFEARQVFLSLVPFERSVVAFPAVSESLEEYLSRLVAVLVQGSSFCSWVKLMVLVLPPGVWWVAFH